MQPITPSNFYAYPGRGRPRRLLAMLAVVALPLTFVSLSEAAPAAASVQNIAFEAPNNERVILGDLASRTQRGPVTISGIGPYTVRGTDSRTASPYEFVTDFNYNPSNAAWQREGDERELTASTRTYTSNTSASFGGRSGVLQLESRANCLNQNTFDGLTTYCSMFGPDVYTESFTASVGQAVSFDWAAQRVSDDYEVYAFLVKVDAGGYGTPEDHTLIAYGRGATQGWTTASKEIPENGTYRFRFVNGSYDQTGGYLLGSRMYIDSVVKLGTANPISFAPLSDRIQDEGPFEVSATAPGGPVVFTTNTTSVCSVSGNTVTLTGALGVCTVLADQVGGGDFVPSETVARSFRVLAEATAPQNVGVPFITGTVAEGNAVSANEGSWVDGGSPITATTFTWSRTDGDTPMPIPGATGPSCMLLESPGATLTVSVTKTNAVGSTTATSVPLSGFTCGILEAPSWDTPQGFGVVVAGDPVSSTFTASGVPSPTYSVAAGALPVGLELDGATGVVSGTPAEAGPYEFTIRATNSAGSADLVVSGVVTMPPGAITGGPNGFVVGESVGGSVAATGTPAPAFSVSGGALPSGVTLDPTTGQFRGAPTVAGPYSFTIAASNGVGTPTTKVFSGTVLQAPTLVGRGAPTIPRIETGSAFSIDLSDGMQANPAPVYRLVSGALPTGLVLNPATGMLTGTPTELGTYSFVIAVDNGVGEALILTFSGEVVDDRNALATTGAAPISNGILLAALLGLTGVLLLVVRRSRIAN